MQVLTGGEAVTEPKRNALRSLDFEGRSVHVAHTGYTGEPLVGAHLVAVEGQARLQTEGIPGPQARGLGSQLDEPPPQPRSACSLFDVSHMGRILVDGTEAVPFLQHVLSSDAAAIAVDQAQYTIIPNERGGAVDDAYLFFGCAGGPVPPWKQKRRNSLLSRLCPFDLRDSRTGRMYALRAAPGNISWYHTTDVRACQQG